MEPFLLRPPVSRPMFSPCRRQGVAERLFTKGAVCLPERGAPSSEGAISRWALWTCPRKMIPLPSRPGGF